jgi:hypothetical protein
MGNITIFKEASNLPTVRRQSRLAEKISTGNSLRRIQTNTNGTFKRIVGGEQIGKAAPHAINVIVVDQLADVSRTFYAEAYDPEGAAKLPDCWSNDGRAPDSRAANPQSASCKACPMNVVGSGSKGKGKACRYRRHLAVLVEGDPSGEVYQLGLAAKSLFGDAVGNTYPYEAYARFLKANGEGPDSVVTRVMYDTEADTLTLKFQAVRHLTQEESNLVDVALADPETERYVQFVANVNTNQRQQAEPARIEQKAEPVKAQAKPRSVFEEEDDATEEPSVVQAAKRGPKKEAPAPKANLAAAMADWGDDEAEED